MTEVNRQIILAARPEGPYCGRWLSPVRVTPKLKSRMEGS
jgi:hypothetical protein